MIHNGVNKCANCGEILGHDGNFCDEHCEYEHRYQNRTCVQCGGEFWDGGTSCTCNDYDEDEFWGVYDEDTRKAAHDKFITEVRQLCVGLYGCPVTYEAELACDIQRILTLTQDPKKVAKIMFIIGSVPENSTRSIERELLKTDICTDYINDLPF